MKTLITAFLTLLNITLFSQTIDPCQECRTDLKNYKEWFETTKKSLEELQGISATNNAEIKNLKKENDELKKTNENLQNSNLKLENTNLSNQVNKLNIKIDSIERCNKSFADTITNIKSLQTTRINNELNKYKQSTSQKAAKYYSDQNIDFILEHFSKQALQKELDLFPENKSLNEIIQIISIIDAAENSLKNKFDTKAINSNIAKIQSISRKSETIKALELKLTDYYIYNENLKNLIYSLNKIDDEQGKAAGNITIETIKFDMMSSQFIYFIIDNPNIADYQYLNQTLLDLAKLKQNNIDASALEFLKRME